MGNLSSKKGGNIAAIDKVYDISIQKNYADSTPVTQQTDKGEAITLNQHDGFEVIYKF